VIASQIDPGYWATELPDSIAADSIMNHLSARS